MKWFPTYQVNLLLDDYDLFCNEYLSGKISKDLFDALEVDYLMKKDLFIVMLN